MCLAWNNKACRVTTVEMNAGIWPLERKNELKNCFTQTYKVFKHDWTLFPNWWITIHSFIHSVTNVSWTHTAHKGPYHTRNKVSQITVNTGNANSLPGQFHMFYSQWPLGEKYTQIGGQRKKHTNWKEEDPLMIKHYS